MKYINPGFPQLMDYQTLNILSAGKNASRQLSNTGYYLDLSSHNGVLFKAVEPTDKCFLLFDIIISNDEYVSSQAEDWIKLFDIYNDTVYQHDSLKLCYKKHTNYKFMLALLNDNEEVISNTYYILTEELNTFEFCFYLQDDLTKIEVYLNNVLQETIVGDYISYKQFNRWNFYGTYHSSITIAVSHVIYKDNERVGNERIKMLNTNKTTALITNDSSDQYVITDTLNEDVYSDIISFGMITNVINNGNLDVNVTETVFGQPYTFKSLSHQEVFNNTNIEKHPQTDEAFTVSDISNNIVQVKTGVEASNVTN